MTKENEVKMQNNINILLNEDSESAILQRKEGKNSLSWIENFGLYLFEKNCIPKIPFQDGESSLILVLRIRNKQELLSESHNRRNTISAYLCFFKTIGDTTRFCVNAASDEDVEGLKDLMVDKAKWTEESTRNWWKEVFRDLKQPIDEDTLRRKEVLASDTLKMNMMDFVNKIQEIIEKATSKLNVDNHIINKVCVVEQFAMALPLRYAIERMFPNAQGNVFSFVWKEKKMPWLQNMSRFNVPGKLLYTTLLTSPQLSIGDILKLEEKGIVITLPLLKENEKYCLPSIPVIDNSDMTWNELMKEHVYPDYIVDDIPFKRVKLSLFADGFQKIYVRCGTNFVACSVFEQDRYKLKRVSPNNSEQTPVGKMPNAKQGWTGKDDKMAKDSLKKKSSLDCNPQSSNDPTSDILTSPNQIDTHSSSDSLKEVRNREGELVSTTNGDTEQELKDNKEKCNAIKLSLGEALDKTTDFLKVIARSYLEEIDPNKSWEIQYGETLIKDNYQYNTWIEHKEVEFSNFFIFLVRNQWKIKGKGTKASWWRSYSDIESAVKYLIIVRNFRVHKKDNVVGIGYDNIYDAFREMRKIASKLKNADLLHDIDIHEAAFKESYDSSIKSLWETNNTLQAIYKEFESTKSKYN